MASVATAFAECCSVSQCYGASRSIRISIIEDALRVAQSERDEEIVLI